MAKKKVSKSHGGGAPVFSFRCPARIARAYRAIARKHKSTPGAMLVRHMASTADKKARA